MYIIFLKIKKYASKMEDKVGKIKAALAVRQQWTQASM